MAKIYKASKNKNYTQDLNKNDDFEETVINIFLFFFFHFPRIYFKITFFEIVWLLCFERESSSIRRLYTASVFIIIRCCALLFLWHKMVLSFINDERNGQKKKYTKRWRKRMDCLCLYACKNRKKHERTTKNRETNKYCWRGYQFFFSSCSLSLSIHICILSLLSSFIFVLHVAALIIFWSQLFNGWTTPFVIQANIGCVFQLFICNVFFSFLHFYFD